MGESLSAQVSKTDLSPLREGCKVKKRRKMADVNVEVVYEANLGTGEGPFWLPQEKAVLFVDIPGHSVLRYDTVTKTTTRATYDGAGNVSFLIPVADNPGKFLIGADLRIALLEWDGTDAAVKVTDVVEVDEHAGNRFNDAKCDRSGRLWAGTMGYVDENGQIADNLSNLYTLVGSTVEKRVTEVSLSNGMAWSEDDATFYYIDTKSGRVDAFDYNIEEGTISNRRTIFTLAEAGAEGVPDGMTIDVNGNLWVATYGGSSVLHINPTTGALIDTIKMPVPNVTSCCWGGENLDELYVTTAANGADLDLYPMSGSLFKVTGLGTKGYESVPVVYTEPKKEKE